MGIVKRLLALTRSIQLNRQFREIEKIIHRLPAITRQQLAALAMKEFAIAAKCEFPHLYATPPNQNRYQPWGTGAELGFSRVKSDNPVVRMRGIALWLAVAYHETKDSPYSEIQGLHRQLIRMLRTLKETAPPEKMNQWFNASQSAA